LGAPHNGPDTSDNIICLCPNHHVMFDLGLFAINDDLSLLGVDGKLKTHVKHPVSVDHIRYHREHFYRNLDV
ncbi:HNH endonuclease, partial [Methylobacillus glycogenes]|uniref:HNH endonuclease n=1 Tax=Methylobacillus glycogenes TaxID=406 RepID=UPI00190077F0